jgi:hypothetical protein
MQGKRCWRCDSIRHNSEGGIIPKPQTCNNSQIHRALARIGVFLISRKNWPKQNPRSLYSTDYLNEAHHLHPAHGVPRPIQTAKGLAMALGNQARWISGWPDFNLLQNFREATRRMNYFVFDLLVFDGLQRRIQAGERNENASITEELTESQVESVAITLNAIDTGTPAPDSVGDELRVSTRT